MVLRLLTVLLLLVLPTFVAAQVAEMPEARSGHELVWHERLGIVLLVNGDHQSSDDPGTIWGWDGDTWQIVTDDAPPIQTLGGVAYDTKRNLLLLHGGSQSAKDYSNATWAWDGSDWEQLEGTSPGTRDHFSMAY